MIKAVWLSLWLELEAGARICGVTYWVRIIVLIRR